MQIGRFIPVLEEFASTARAGGVTGLAQKAGNDEVSALREFRSAIDDAQAAVSGIGREIAVQHRQAQENGLVSGAIPVVKRDGMFVPGSVVTLENQSLATVNGEKISDWQLVGDVGGYGTKAIAEKAAMDLRSHDLYLVALPEGSRHYYLLGSNSHKQQRTLGLFYRKPTVALHAEAVISAVEGKRIHANPIKTGDVHPAALGESYLTHTVDEYGTYVRVDQAITDARHAYGELLTDDTYKMIAKQSPASALEEWFASQTHQPFIDSVSLNWKTDALFTLSDDEPIRWLEGARSPEEAMTAAKQLFAEDALAVVKPFTDMDIYGVTAYSDNMRTRYQGTGFAEVGTVPRKPYLTGIIYSGGDHQLDTTPYGLLKGYAADPAATLADVEQVSRLHRYAFAIQDEQLLAQTNAARAKLMDSDDPKTALTAWFAENEHRPFAASGHSDWYGDELFRYSDEEYVRYLDGVESVEEAVEHAKLVDSGFAVAVVKPFADRNIYGLTRYSSDGTNPYAGNGFEGMRELGPEPYLSAVVAGDNVFRIDFTPYRDLELLAKSPQAALGDPAVVGRIYKHARDAQNAELMAQMGKHLAPLMESADPRTAINAWFLTDDHHPFAGGTTNWKPDVLYPYSKDESMHLLDGVTTADEAMDAIQDMQRNDVLVAVKPFPDRDIYGVTRYSEGGNHAYSGTSFTSVETQPRQPYLVGIATSDATYQLMTAPQRELAAYAANPEAALTDPKTVWKLAEHAREVDDKQMMGDLQPAIERMKTDTDPAIAMTGWFAGKRHYPFTEGASPNWLGDRLHPYARTNPVRLLEGVTSTAEAMSKAHELFSADVLAVVKPFADRDVYGVTRYASNLENRAYTGNGFADVRTQPRDGYLMGIVHSGGTVQLNHEVEYTQVLARDPGVFADISRLARLQEQAQLDGREDVLEVLKPYLDGVRNMLELEGRLETDPKSLGVLNMSIVQARKELRQLQPTTDMGRQLHADIIKRLDNAVKTIEHKKKKNLDGVVGYANYPDYKQLGEALADWHLLQILEPRQIPGQIGGQAPVEPAINIAF